MSARSPWQPATKPAVDPDALTRAVEEQLRPKPPVSNLDALLRMIAISVVFGFLAKACGG